MAKMIDADAMLADVAKLRSFSEQVKYIPCRAGHLTSLDAVKRKIESLPDASEPILAEAAALRARVGQLEAEKAELLIFACRVANVENSLEFENIQGEADVILEKHRKEPNNAD